MKRFILGCLFYLTPACALGITLGERLEYQVVYNGYASSFLDWEVADASFTVNPTLVAFAQEHAYQLLVEVDSSAYALADTLFKARFSYKSLLNASKTRNLLVEEKNNGTRLKHKVVWFDWQRHFAQLFKIRRKKKINTSWMSSEKRWVVLKNENIPEWLLQNYTAPKLGVPYFRDAGKGRIPIEEGIVDQLSATYLFRTQDIVLGKRYDFPICTGKKVLTYSLTVDSEKTLKVNGKKWETYEVTINTDNLPGVFQRSDDSHLKVWITRDAQHIPVLFEVGVKYGVFTVSLK